MRLVHLSDTHLGYSDYGKFDSLSGVNQREIDTYNVFKEIVDYILETKPDLVIHAGDLFDSIRPSNRAISEAMGQLFRLSKEGIPTVIIAGNHSTPRQKSNDSIFGILKFFPNIYPIFEGKYTKLNIGDCAIHAIPHTYSDEDLQRAIEQLKPDASAKYNVMVAHAAVRGTETASWGEFKEQTIPMDCLAPEFNYIALGHYHKFIPVKKNAYYCGSPERFSFNEVDDKKKGFLDVNLDGLEVKHISTKAREMIVFPPISCDGLSAVEVMNAFESLVSGKVDGKIVRVTFNGLTKNVHSSLDMERIRQLVKGALHFHPDWNWKMETADGKAVSSRIGSLSDEFEDFLNRLAIDEGEREEMLSLGRQYLAQVVEEAGVE